MAAAEEQDEWLFDYLVEVFRSDRWEYNVLQFIDENCHLFNNDETNDFALTEAHQQFRNLIDGLLTQHLAEIGVSEEAFVQACEHGRNNSASRQVFEQIMAVDDFLTFKKLMVKRNMELEFEVVKAMAAQGDPVRETAPQNKADEAKQLEAALEASRKNGQPMIPEDPKTKLNTQREEQHAAEFDAAVRANIAATDLYHQQLALEQAELEQALTISLQLEEERLRSIQAAADLEVEDVAEEPCPGGGPGGGPGENPGGGPGGGAEADISGNLAKCVPSAEAKESDNAESLAPVEITGDAKLSHAQGQPGSARKSVPFDGGSPSPAPIEHATSAACATHASPDRTSSFGVKHTGAGFSSVSTHGPRLKRVAEPKQEASAQNPIGRSSRSHNSLALPPIQPGRAGISLMTTNQAAIPSMQRQLETQRNVVLSSFKQTEKIAPLRALSSTISPSLSAADMEVRIAARAAHMRRQRELIIAKKKAERKAKLKKSEMQKDRPVDRHFR